MTTSWSGLFLDWATGMTDYIARHTANYARIQTCLDYLHAMSGGSVTLLDVPNGMQEIFDRAGLIGKDSYKIVAATLTGPNYLLNVPKGACYLNDTFLRKVSSTSISLKDATTGTYYINIDAAGNPSISSTAGAACVWDFYWNASTKAVSAVVMHTGLSILFDGDDYHACLTSTAFAGHLFTSLAERLDYLENYFLNVAGLPSDFVKDDTSSGLNLIYKSGKVRNNNVVTEVPSDNLSLLAFHTHYMEVNPVDGEVRVNTSGFTADWIPLFIYMTNGTVITSTQDKRCWLAAGGGGGGGGGHTQNTDTGSTSYDFTLAQSASGVPASNVRLRAKRGSSPTVDIRWNELIDKWQWTEDGVNYRNFGDVTVDLGAQEISKYVAVEDPPMVLNDVGRGTSIDYEDIDLSSFVEAPDGLSAVVLRVFFLDTQDPPTTANDVRFKTKGIAAVPALANTVYSPALLDLSRPQTLIIAPDDTNCIQYFVNASGLETANIAVFLVGYYKKILGVGSQNKLFGETNLAGVKNTVNVFELSGFCNRGLIRNITVAQTVTGGGAPTGFYDIRIYGKSPFNRDQLMYEAVGLEMDVAWVDYLPWFYYNEDGNNKLYLEIQHHGTDFDGLFNVTVKAEQFA